MPMWKAEDMLRFHDAQILYRSGKRPLDDDERSPAEDEEDAKKESSSLLKDAIHKQTSKVFVHLNFTLRDETNSPCSKPTDAKELTITITYHDKTPQLRTYFKTECSQLLNELSDKLATGYHHSGVTTGADPDAYSVTVTQMEFTQENMSSLQIYLIRRVEQMLQSQTFQNLQGRLTRHNPHLKEVKWLLMPELGMGFKATADRQLGEVMDSALRKRKQTRKRQTWKRTPSPLRRPERRDTAPLTLPPPSGEDTEVDSENEWPGAEPPNWVDARRKTGT